MAFSATLFPHNLSFQLRLVKPHHHHHHHHHRHFLQTISCSVSTQTQNPNTPFDLRTYWTDLISQIDHQLNQAIPLRYPERIFEAMRYSVLAKAKRAPPVMCIAACELLGGQRVHAFPTACALEMVHSASLIHDDLPCMDDDPRRRGCSSNHTVFGVDMAILAGDALFPLGFQHIVSSTPADVPPERVLRVVAEIARAVGSRGMVSGQYLDLKSSRVEITDPGLVGVVQEKKFGEMAECSAVCGGILGGGSEEEVERLRRYGRAVGVLYQVVDDVIQVKREEGRVQRNKVSYATVFGVDKALQVAQELRIKAKRELAGFGESEAVAPLYSFVDYAVERGFDIDGKAQAQDQDELPSHSLA